MNSPRKIEVTVQGIEVAKWWWNRVGGRIEKPPWNPLPDAPFVITHADVPIYKDISEPAKLSDEIPYIGEDTYVSLVMTSHRNGFSIPHSADNVAAISLVMSALVEYGVPIQNADRFEVRILPQ